jgi:hypothetical protein
MNYAEQQRVLEGAEEVLRENKVLRSRIAELEKELDVEKAKNAAWEKVWRSSLPTVSTGERCVIYAHKKE